MKAKPAKNFSSMKKNGFSIPVAYEIEMHRLIKESAYLLAEEDSFKKSPIDYWLAAEQTMHASF